jgi:hypothetical protein
MCVLTVEATAGSADAAPMAATKARRVNFMLAG